MAVTITVAALAAAIRVGDTAAETAEITRLRAYAITTVSRHLGTAYAGAPDTVVDEATVRLCAYLYDAPTVSSGDRLANSLRNSGAASILLPYRLHRAGIIDPVAEAQVAVGTADNPVVDVSVAAHVLTVSFADGATTTYTLPAGGSGDDAYSWATVGDTTLIPAAKLRAPTSALRGAVFAVTNAIIDSDAHTAATLYGWSRSHVLRLIDRIVNVWARDATTPIPAAKLTLAPSSGTQVFVSTDIPTGTFRLDDIWIRDVTTSPLQIYKWTGTVWSVTYTLPNIPTGADIDTVVRSPGGHLRSHREHREDPRLPYRGAAEATGREPARRDPGRLRPQRRLCARRPLVLHRADRARPQHQRLDVGRPQRHGPQRPRPVAGRGL